MSSQANTSSNESKRKVNELDAAAVKLQKVYKGYRTRRNLADCAVVVEELWWKGLDFCLLEKSSISFFENQTEETAISRWERAGTKAAKVGKGLLKDAMAQIQPFPQWLEIIDPYHRYYRNLHFYYDVWFDSDTVQPFFYWLDVGDGKEVDLEKCSRSNLQRQCIQYLAPKEREYYEVIIEHGKLVYKQSGILVNTVEDCKWIFVLSASRSLYVGEKKKGSFHHSSFVAGGATLAAGGLVAHEEVLEAIWPNTDEDPTEFISFLEEHNVEINAIDGVNHAYGSTTSRYSNSETEVDATKTAITSA